MNIHIMLTDDHALIREGLKQLIEIDDEIRVISEAVDGTDCINKLEVFLPDIILLDINMPKMNGIEVLEHIKRKKIDVKVIMLTVHNEAEYLMKAIDLGVEGYVLKDAGFDELKKAIKTVYNGESFIEPTLIPALNARMIARNSDKEKLNLLTRREIEVLISITNGMFNREIALELDISEQTVKNHISNIFKKLDVLDRTQAAIFAIKNDVVKII